MDLDLTKKVEEAKHVALDVVRHNARSGWSGLPRTAAWGYPEPYTRDLMIASLGMLASGHVELIDALRRTLISLADHQSPLGLIPGLADDSEDFGSSDTTPLFLIGLALYRKVSVEPTFLQAAADKAITWMKYQSPSDSVIVAQQPTTDWRDEQWVLGFGLYVNTLVYTYLRLFGRDERAEALKMEMNRPDGLALQKKPHYALWSFKLYCNERFDLLGNSLAILSGVATRKKAESIVAWVEASCRAMRDQGLLAIDLPPNLFPYIEPADIDWRNRYKKFNNPGEYHNGGVWPFVCGFYIAALVAAGRRRLAERKLAALTDLVRGAQNPDLAFGFNEWIRAQDGIPHGEDWQIWSAAMYVYAAECVTRGTTPYFDAVRGPKW